MKKAQLISQFILFFLILGLALYSCGGKASGKTEIPQEEQPDDDPPEPDDADFDGVEDEIDNCPLEANEDQLDTDEDGFGDICDACPEDPDDRCLECPDADEDSFLDSACGGDDCNDNDAAVYPGATEVCNDIDDDCNEEIDDGLVFLTFYEDQDLDGFGDPNKTAKTACATPQGFAEKFDNCPDTENPEQEDRDYDGVGDACDNCPKIFNPIQDDACSFTQTILLFDEESIQAAIDNIEEGGLIKLAGSFPIRESIEIKKSVTIMSEEGITSEIVRDALDSAMNTGLINIDLRETESPKKIRIIGIEINGNRKENTRGIVIEASENDYVLIQDCEVTKNSYRSGGGLYVLTHDTQNDIIVVGNSINNNKGSWGGGIHAKTLGTENKISILNNDIFDNSVESEEEYLSGGGMHTVITGTSNEIFIMNNRIYNNASFSKAGGISSIVNNPGVDIIDGKIFIANNLIYGNYADAMGAGIAVSMQPDSGSGNDISVMNNTFYDNSSPSGGAMWVWSKHEESAITLVNNLITESKESEAVVINPSTLGTLTINNNGFFNNEIGDCNRDLDETNITCSPNYLDIESFDFHVSSDSSCIDKGDESVLGVLGLDIEANPRKLGLGADLGAYEIK